ncbi:MAG: TylF/MycF/NovP-related O-methyltransferase [Rhodocyclaceae bacterium]
MASALGGHYVGDDYKLWLQDERFTQRFRELSPHNQFSMERKYALRELARSVVNLDGAVAECGSYVGVSAWFVASVIDGADFYLFDSFEGLSEPSKKDSAPEGLPQWQRGDLSATESELRRNLEDFLNIHVLKGWIPERFEDVFGLDFKLVHIDVDLYQPTLDSLEFFYPRLVAGGVIVMDDYGFANCPGAFEAANHYMRDKPECIIHLPTGQGVIIKR